MRKLLLWGGVFGSFFLFCLSAWAAPVYGNGKKPNIVLILTDDQGYHDISYYGTKDIRTPHLDALCRAGLRFDRFYTNSSVCSPTRAALMSGRYPGMVGVPGLIRSNPSSCFGYLKPDAILIPAMLKKAGYHTAMIGKWNLGLQTPNTPNEKGFDLFHGFLDDMMNDYWNHLRNGKNFMRKNDELIHPEGHATDVFTRWAVDYIEEQRKETTPFFLYLAYNAPHYPVQPPDEWLKRVKVREPGLDERRAGLVALIEHLDDGIGQVVNALKRTGVYENTLILFMSDNGGYLEDGADNGRLRDGKGSMYEGGIRVPAFAVWPGVVDAGRHTSQPVMTMDVFPTLAQITSVPVTHRIDGKSFLSLLKDPETKPEERPLFFSRREGGLRFGGQTIQAVIEGDWKLLQNTPYSPYELYNLHSDPEEEKNVISYEPDRHKRLQLLLIRHIQQSGSVPWQQPE